MAFTKNPQVSTYQTKPIRLANQLDGRSSSAAKDAQFLNVFFEPGSKEDKIIHVVKRAGTETFGSSLPVSSVRGLFYWEDENKVLVANDNDIIVINATTAATITTLSNVFSSTSGDVGFTEFLYDDNSVKVVATDGTTMITIDTSNTVVTGADADMPVHLPQPIFLDGYIFVIKADTADIYNSNLNSPLAWTAGDFISCEMFPDTVVRLAKLNNYLVVFGSSSVEYFWDAANASGSPLQRNDTPVKLVGYLGGYAQHGNKIYFVGNSSTGTPEVFFLEDFKIQPIADETVRRYLGSISADLSTTIGTVVSFMGHDFYVINVSTQTYAFDLKVQNWARWAFKALTTFAVEQSVIIRSSTTYSSLVYVNGQTTLHRFSDSLYQDAGTNFTIEIITPLQSFDTYNQKFMYRLIVVGDRPTSSSLLSVQWTDDDYQNYNTARTINLNQDFPAMFQLGKFRRRAFKLSYAGANPIRLNSLEVDINLGQT